ncbi:Protein-export membrane protein SecF [Rickettsiales endosymbiont of Paramecium tredecaurelia]|uniref:protein translocase subunit SecF n=1 Tax=Candidatus Sarmatiella mevalonica TaxID=2770581 RepID=UPI0019246A0E|nr:protein translocase subunit SecF [Candidatus Sarmatiella mevalonica]MBL3284273.1 Protein-export membrane protein SecF [Candidatus Sarmatiella mevalonica]
MRFFPLKLISENTAINFTKHAKITYFFSILITILSIIIATIYGFNFGIDFVGGVNIEVRSNQEINLHVLRDALDKLVDVEDVSVQKVDVYDTMIRAAMHKGADLMGTVNAMKQVIIDNVSTAQDGERKALQNTQSTIENLTNSSLENQIEFRKVDFVGPQVGEKMIKTSIIAVLLSFLGIMLYIWFRFEWFFSFGVLIALAHDVLLALGFMSLTGLDFNLGTIAAILTIIGYSVNDSVVIYDRVRENLRKYHNKPLADIINLSVNQTLSRTVLTVLTVVLANAALVFFGTDAIRSFSWLCLFGIIVGTYSSILVSAPILTLFIKK